MKKILTIALFSVFAFSFVAGILATPVKAKNTKIPCEYRCINHDWYLCCIYPAPVGEVCTFYQMGC